MEDVTQYALLVRQQKRDIRKKMRALRDAVAPEQRAVWSAAICDQVTALPAYQTAKVVHCYLPARSEVDTRAIIEHALTHGKRVVVPLWQRDNPDMLSCEIDTLADEAYTKDSFGLNVPRELQLVEPEEIDLVLAPLLAFAPLPQPLPDTGRGAGRSHPRSDTGRGVEGGSGFARLGYGAGFYDRFLRNLRAPKVGVAFEMQRVDALPQTEMDTPLDDVITECVTGRE